MKQLSVIGSVNIDILVQVKSYPKEGETVVGENLFLVPGGKGANQAIAATKMGLPTKFFGCIGDDVFGRLAIAGLETASVDIHNLTVLNNQMTGAASVILDHNRENRIIIIPGANNFMSQELVNTFWGEISKSSMILIQHEIPLETVFHIIRKANKNGIKVMLNPAPFFPIPPNILKLVDYLIINEIEAEALLGIKIRDKESAINVARSHFSSLGVTSLVITLGAKGSVYVDKFKSIYHPAFIVDVLDTTGAGDTFVGGFAASIISGESEQISLQYASAAAALAVSSVGAQSAIPTINQVKDFISKVCCPIVEIYQSKC